MRVAVVGGGIAGVALAWRLSRLAAEVVVHLYAGAPRTPDATRASGGLVRGFEPDLSRCRLAAESLAELQSDPQLQEWAGYCEVGSTYLLPSGPDPRCVSTVSAWLPRSLHVDPNPGLPFLGLDEGTVAVVEERAGYLSPGRLRDRILADLPGRRTEVIDGEVAEVTLEPAVQVRGADRRRYDAVAICAGAWSPQLLRRSGFPSARFRTKHVQYTLGSGHIEGLGAFVDDTSGLYGRPAGAGAVLLGIGGRGWDVSADECEPDEALNAQTLATARRRLGPGVAAWAARHTIAMADCYDDPPGLVLRPVVAGGALFTFTGGSGGAAKSVLASSRAAAAGLATALGSRSVGDNTDRDLAEPQCLDG